ncbi:MAG: aldose 1-epimerase family protein, partial [Oscillospiraceae bacterium]|nr:aldose 1-epimerase family protein [Oscillospiraceae bacterium]
MDFKEFPYLGIWTQNKPEYTHYVCIEPWTTLPECEFTDSALEHKPGIRVLEPGQEESLSYSFTVSE